MLATTSRHYTLHKYLPMSATPTIAARAKTSVSVNTTVKNMYATMFSVPQSWGFPLQKVIKQRLLRVHATRDGWMPLPGEIEVSAYRVCKKSNGHRTWSGRCRHRALPRRQPRISDGKEWAADTVTNTKNTGVSYQRDRQLTTSMAEMDTQRTPCTKFSQHCSNS